MANKDVTIRPEKQAIVSEIRGRMDGSNFAMVVDFNGMTVDLSAQMRGELRGLGSKMFVCKNRMILAALSDREYIGAWKDLLKGSSALITGGEDAVTVAKTLKKICKDNEGLSLKCGMLDGIALDSEQLMQIADLPGKEELQGQLVATLAEPMRQIAGVLQQAKSGIVYVLKAFKDKQEAA